MSAQVRAPHHRLVASQGIRNFRDFGGYAIAGGGHLVTGRLYRSGQHSSATPADLGLMQAMGIACCVDLRGTSERESAPCARIPSCELIVADGETAEMAPHLEAAQALDAAAARRTLTGRYATLPFRPALTQAYGAYLRMLARSDRASVVYCSAGKDRTGLLVALVHTMLGVHEDDVMADYCLTNSVECDEGRIEHLRKELSKRFGPMSTEAARVVLSVEPAYLAAAFHAIDERYTSLDRYLQHELGITPSLREAIAAKLIA